MGRVVGRDIGGADPERMAPPRVVEYIQDLFEKSADIKVKKLFSPIGNNRIINRSI